MIKKSPYPVPALIKKARSKQQFRGMLRIKDLAVEANSVDLWLHEEQITIGVEQVQSIIAYAAYREWCEKKQLDKNTIASIKAFGHRIKESHLFPNVIRKNKTYYSMNKSLSQYEEKSLQFQNEKNAATKKNTKKDPS